MNFPTSSWTLDHAFRDDVISWDKAVIDSCSAWTSGDVSHLVTSSVIACCNCCNSLCLAKVCSSSRSVAMSCLEFADSTGPVASRRPWSSFRSSSSSSLRFTRRPVTVPLSSPRCAAAAAPAVSARHFKRPSCSETCALMPCFQRNKSCFTVGDNSCISSTRAPVCGQSEVICSCNCCSSLWTVAHCSVTCSSWGPWGWTAGWSLVFSRVFSSSSLRAENSATCAAESARCWVAVLGRKCVKAVKDPIHANSSTINDSSNDFRTRPVQKLAWLV